MIEQWVAALLAFALYMYMYDQLKSYSTQFHYILLVHNSFNNNTISNLSKQCHFSVTAHVTMFTVTSHSNLCLSYSINHVGKKEYSFRYNLQNVSAKNGKFANTVSK